MILYSALFLAGSAWSQIKGAAALPVLPSAGVAGEAPALAPLPSLAAPASLPGLSPLPAAGAALPDLPPLEQALEPSAVQGGAQTPTNFESAETGVESALQQDRLKNQGEDDSYSLGEKLQGMLEGAPAGESGPGLSAAPEASPEASAAELLSQVQSKTARRALSEKIYADPLTRLLKRSWVYDHLPAVMQRNTAVMMVDLDHFKKGVNDRYGHDVGDIALSELARIMAEEAAPGQVQVRWGGEEFLIIDRLGSKQAGAAAENLRQAVEQRLAPAVQRQAKLKLGRQIEMGVMTASIGVAAMKRGTGSDRSDLLASIEEADKRLFDAKAGGRNQVQSSAPELWPAARPLASLWDKAAQWWKVLTAPKAAPAPSAVDELLAQVSNPGLRQKLTDKLYTDSLTQTRNRAHLNDHVEALVGRYRSILYVDVDRFKRVNDVYGHVRAGEILAHLGVILKEHGGEAVYVMGGEEFMIMSEGSPAEAMAQAEKLRAAVEARLGAETGIETTTVSIGVAEFDKTQAPREALQAAVTAADQALYQSKQTGRNRVTLAGSQP